MWAFGKAYYPELLLLLLRWCLVCLYACFGWDRSIMLAVTFLTCLFTSCYILPHGYLLVISLWSPCANSPLFCKSWHNYVFNCSNTYLYALWRTIILDLMHNISFFSWFVFDEFIAKGGGYGHKVGWTLANWVVERRNMINVYLRGRAIIDSVRRIWFIGSFFLFRAFLDFQLFLLYSWFCHFSCLLLDLRFFLLLDDILELFFGFMFF
jgi:hypothetical protein